VDGPGVLTWVAGERCKLDDLIDEGLERHFEVLGGFELSFDDLTDVV